MPDTLFPQAGALLQGAAKSAADLNTQSDSEIQSAGDLAQKSSASSSAMVEQRMGDTAAMDRQKQAATQRIAEAITQAKIDAEAQRQKYLQDTVEVPPEFAAGMVKTSGNPAYSKLAGQRVPWKEMFAGFSAEVKGKYTKPISTQIMENGKPVNLLLTPVEDQNGNVTWTPQRVGEAVPKPTPVPRGTGGKAQTYEGYSAAADKLLQNINTTLNKKGVNLKTNTRDKILKVFGATDESKQAKIAALKQQYSDYQTAVQNANQMAEAEGKTPKVIDPSVKQAMDTLLTLDTGTAAPAATGNPDQAVIDYLKDPQKNGTGKVIRDTPANRAWAKDQIGG